MSLVALIFFHAAAKQHAAINSAPAKNKRIHITGQVVSLPKRSAQYQQFQLYLPKYNKTVSLFWYNIEKQVTPGSIWQLTVKLRQPGGLADPGVTNFQKWYFYQGIAATGYVYHDKYNQQLAAAKANYLLRLRASIKQKLLNLTKQYKCAKAAPHDGQQHNTIGIIIALLLGDRSHLDPQTWDLFRDTGTSHLVAISGLHIGLVSGLVFLLWARLWRCSAKLCEVLPVRKAAAIAAMLAALIYSALAGLSLPTLRALMMVLIAACATLSDRHIGIYKLYLWALVLVLALFPLSVLADGFYLSFAAVLVLIYGMGQRYQPFNRWQQFLRPQILISIALLPLNIAIFQRVALFSLLANTLAIPWLGFIIFAELFVIINHFICESINKFIIIKVY